MLPKMADILLERSVAVNRGMMTTAIIKSMAIKKYPFHSQHKNGTWNMKTVIENDNAIQSKYLLDFYPAKRGCHH